MDKWWSGKLRAKTKGCVALNMSILCGVCWRHPESIRRKQIQSVLRRMFVSFDWLSHLFLLWLLRYPEACDCSICKVHFFYSALIKPVTERICQKNHLDMKSLGFTCNPYPLSIVFKKLKRTVFMPALPITPVRLLEYFQSLKRVLKSILL